MLEAVPDDARLVGVEELKEVTVCDFVARSSKQMLESTNPFERMPSS